MVLADLVDDLSKSFLINIIDGRMLVLERVLCILHYKVIHIDACGFVLRCLYVSHSEILSPTWLLHMGVGRLLLLSLQFLHLLLFVLLLLELFELLLLLARFVLGCFDSYTLLGTSLSIFLFGFGIIFLLLLLLRHYVV